MLLREIIMLDRPSGGSIRLFGEELRGIGEMDADRLRRRIGVMFQQGALFSSLTVMENVAAPLREHTDLPAVTVEVIAGLKVALAGLPGEAVSNWPST